MESRDLRRIDGNRLPVKAEVITLKPNTMWSAVQRPAQKGFGIMLMFVGVFAYWGCIAPLDGGAVAPGIVSLDGSKKSVQHLEGGMIAKLHVREGDVIAADEPLLELESLQAKATFDILLQDYRTQLAARARLEAEKAGRKELTFPSDLNQSMDPDLRRILDDQRHLFQSRQNFHEGRRSVLFQREAQLREQVIGFQAQVTSTSQQFQLITEELKSKTFLHDRQLIAKPEVLRLERAKAEIFGKRGEYQAQIARAAEQIGETKLQLMTLDAEKMDQVAGQLDQVRTKFAEAEQKLQASRDVLARTVVRAPVGGKILNMKFKTIGGVVQRGEVILDIVPLDDKLLIDARVSPNDIDIVRAGLTATVHLTAYSSRGTPKVSGIVRTVSADRVTDEITKQHYFLARVEVDRAELERLPSNIKLLPGMPAEALIVTEKRTFAGYLLQPFLDVLRRSFREV